MKLYINLRTDAPPYCFQHIIFYSDCTVFIHSTYKMLPSFMLPCIETSHFCAITCHGLHIYVFILGRGTDVMDSAIYCRWIPAHCTSHCVARSSSGGKPQGIFASTGILAWGHWRHGTPCCGR